MSDHGFANFGWQFNLNSWLRDWGFLHPSECTSVLHDVDWSQTVAYGLGINGLYLNLKGRETDGIVEPGEAEDLITEITNRLVEATKWNEEPVRPERVRDGGRNVTLEPRAANREVSAVSGPFRVVAPLVTGRLLVESGTAYHEVQLEAHWEPRMPVFRIDSNPKITKAEDDRGRALVADPSISRHHPTVALTDMKVRLTGLTRDSKRIATLAGEFRATAAEKLLTIPFKSLAGKFPATQTADGVKVVLKSFTKVAGFWEAELEMTYPEGHPNFESFEEQKWLRDTRLRLVGADGKPFEPDNDDVVASGRNVTATYRYKLLSTMNPTGKDCSLVLETPGPLKEVTVPFVLKNIPIP